jgi:predicted nucleotidyltransferase component of viral defense system
MDSRIERLHEKIEVLLEESAYQRAKLEEVHARTADIPAMVDETHTMKRRLFHLAGGVLGLAVVQVVQIWDSLKEVFLG